jgi:hypothetical protein
MYAEPLLAGSMKNTRNSLADKWSLRTGDLQASSSVESGSYGYVEVMTTSVSPASTKAHTAWPPIKGRRYSSTRAQLSKIFMAPLSSYLTKHSFARSLRHDCADTVVAQAIENQRHSSALRMWRILNHQFLSVESVSPPTRKLYPAGAKARIIFWAGGPFILLSEAVPRSSRLYRDERVLGWNVGSDGTDSALHTSE